MSHAASAFFPSPFEEAAVLTMDGVGEWATTSAGVGRGNDAADHKEIHFPHSLGLLYSAFTYYTGFKVNSGEYKVMGLAPYGEPKYAQMILDHLIDLKADGSFRLNLDYFDYCTGLTHDQRALRRAVRRPGRASPRICSTQRHMDLAASIQAVTEEVVLRLTRSLAAETGLRNLCLAGGVALNCVANGKVLRDGRFDDIWIQPAAGDAGGALGAALAAYHLRHQGSRAQRSIGSMACTAPISGPHLRRATSRARLNGCRRALRPCSTSASLIERSARRSRDGKAVGWFQGRMEFGPRALGNRSILGDPRSPTMQKTLNLQSQIPRELPPLRAVRAARGRRRLVRARRRQPLHAAGRRRRQEAARRRNDAKRSRALFGIDKLNVPRSDIPAVTHVDYSARIQTVHAETNPRYHALISRFQGA